MQKISLKTKKNVETHVFNCHLYNNIILNKVIS